MSRPSAARLRLLEILSGLPPGEEMNACALQHPALRRLEEDGLVTGRRYGRQKAGSFWRLTDEGHRAVLRMGLPREKP